MVKLGCGSEDKERSRLCRALTGLFKINEEINEDNLFVYLLQNKIFRYFEEGTKLMDSFKSWNDKTEASVQQV